MKEKKLKNKITVNKCLIFILVIFCFVGIPALLLSYSVYRYFQGEEEQLVYNLKSNMQKITNELKRNLQAEKYFCRLFYENVMSNANNPNYSLETCINYCKKLKENFGKGINFLVITNDGKIKYNSDSISLNHKPKVWFDAYHFTRYHLTRVKNSIYNGYSGSIKAARQVFGPQLISDSLGTLIEESDLNLMWVDSSGLIPPSGVYHFQWGGFIVFISKDLLNDVVHFKYNLMDLKLEDNLISGIINFKHLDDFWSGKEIQNVDDVKKALVESESQGGNFTETEYYYICHQYLIRDLRVFSIVKKKNTKMALWFKAIIVMLVYFLISMPIIIYFWNTIVLKIPGTASIRLKLAFLFLYASGIPLLSLSVIAHEYEIHKRMTLMEDSRLWAVENLLGIEQRFMAYLKSISFSLEEYIDKWAEGLKKKNGFNNQYTQTLYRKGNEYGAFDFYCISSDTPYIAATEGLFKYYGSLDSIKFDRKKSSFNTDYLKDYRIDELKLANIVIKKFCSDFNGTDIPSFTLDKLELIAENIIQKTFTEITYTIVETVGSIKEWGFGNKTNMTFFKLISLNKNQITDYIAFLSWKPVDLQRQFIEYIIPKANRNDKQFKVIAFERYEKNFNPGQYKNNKELKRFAKRAGDKPTEELEILNIDGEDYIAVSFLGRGLYRYAFIGLFPMRNINVEVKNQSVLLWVIGGLCLILSIGLAQLLAKSFIKPLVVLQDGALAIENRNFEHRLSGLGVDEFGEVGGIFNHVMVGLEELEVSKIVQESMFPKPDFKQGKFSVYGKSVTMIDVGGDYLDFFKVDDNSFAVLLGDVAGHGVGAAVIVAMAKAAILGGGDLLRSPLAVLNSLHKMILATKNSKQKKIMTFQYMYINSETGENLYANAGACSPLLIRHSNNSVEEIKMAAPVLGAFKKSFYSEMPLDFKPGDTLVFYTDGIVECKNKQGEMLGYNRLRDIVFKSWDDDLETYYNKIFDEYYKFVGAKSEAEDDLTFVILRYNGGDGKMEKTEN